MNNNDDFRRPPHCDPHGRRGSRRGPGWGDIFGAVPGPEDEYSADDSPRPGRARPPRGAWFGMGPMGFGPGDPFGFPGGRGRQRGGRVRRGDVRLAILALLAEQPSNGYQIIQTLAERTAQAWRPSPGAVYPALNQLEDEGLIEPFDNAGQKGFRLTEAGQEAAAKIETAPWEQVNDEHPGNYEGFGDFWKEFGALAAAAKSVMSSGTPEQLRAATKVLADTRRRLYGLLADEGQD